MKKFIAFFLLYSICLFGKSKLPIVGDISPYIKLKKTVKLSDITDNKTDYAILEAKDGISVLISQPAFKHITLESKNDIWESKTDILPTTCNLNDLREIILFKPNLISRITIIDGDKLTKFSAFDFYFTNFKKLGSSSKNGFYITKLKKIGKPVFNYRKAKITLMNNSEKIIADEEISKIFVKNGKFFYQKNQIKQIKVLEK